MLHLGSSSCGEFLVICILQIVADDFACAFIDVYGPQTRQDKLRMCDELRCLKDGWSGPWCIGGIPMEC